MQPIPDLILQYASNYQKSTKPGWLSRTVTEYSGLINFYGNEKKEINTSIIKVSRFTKGTGEQIFPFGKLRLQGEWSIAVQVCSKCPRVNHVQNIEPSQKCSIPYLGVYA